eukprot:03942.XXX_110976_111182_1 [CDS] Oithona nana genome sequencing.
MIDMNASNSLWLIWQFSGLFSANIDFKEFRIGHFSFKVSAMKSRRNSWHSTTRFSLRSKLVQTSSQCS